MSRALVFAVLLAGLPAAAFAQEQQNNPANALGNAAGAIVQAPATALGGIFGGLTGTHQYATQERVASYTWPGHRIVVGEVLPARVALYPAPSAYSVTRYRYTVVNNTPILVEPSTRRIVEIAP